MSRGWYIAARRTLDSNYWTILAGIQCPLLRCIIQWKLLIGCHEIFCWTWINCIAQRCRSSRWNAVVVFVFTSVSTTYTYIHGPMVPVCLRIHGSLTPFRDRAQVAIGLPVYEQNRACTRLLLHDYGPCPVLWNLLTHTVPAVSSLDVNIVSRYNYVYLHDREIIRQVRSVALSLSFSFSPSLGVSKILDKQI